VDGGRHVGGEHAPERVGERHALAGQGVKIKMPGEARLRLFGGDDFEELLLARRRAHRVGEPIAGRFTRALRAATHGSACIATVAPGGKPSRSGATNTKPSACANACKGKYPDAIGATPSSSRRTSTTSAMPTVEAILRARRTGIPSSGAPPVSRVMRWRP